MTRRTTSAWNLAACAALVLAVMACGADDAAPGETGEPLVGAGGFEDGVGEGSDAWVQVGTGAELSEFEPVEDGARLNLEWGIQGGYHIWGALEGEGFERQGAHFRFELLDGSLQVGGADYVDDILIDPDTGLLTYGGVSVFVFNDFEIETLHDRPLTMRLELTDTAGVVLRDEMSLVANCCHGGPSPDDDGVDGAGNGDAGNGDAGSGDGGSGDAGSGDGGSGDGGE